MGMFSRIGAAALALISATAVHATQIYTAPPGLTASEATASLGLNFTVNSHIIVSALGVFDGGGDGLNRALTVSIFDRDTQALVVAPLTFAKGTPNASHAPYLFSPIAPILLGAGHYQLNTSGFFWEEMAFNHHGSGGPIQFNDLGGALTADGTAYGFGPGFAPNADTGLTRYGAASLIADVPEPASWAMMLAGFTLLGARLRRRRPAVSLI